MGQPRASRRRVVKSDDEDEEASAALGPVASEDEAPVKPRKRSTGKLKSVAKRNGTQQPTPVASSQQTGSQRSPAKSRKSSVKDAPKPVGKPIYSFFNAATQRQQLSRSSQPSVSPEKPASQDQTEAIHDNSDDGGSSLAFAKGSSTALAMRKRKVHHSQDSRDESGMLPPSTQKFRKTSDGGRTPSFSALNEDKRPWTEQFAPNDLSELAVHKRKVADVRQWLDTALNGRRHKVLVLKGAAGTGKTTTISLLAKYMDLEISEWRNPALSGAGSDDTLSTATQFEEFVRRAGRSTGLALAADSQQQYPIADNKMSEKIAGSKQVRQLLLIEEFPSTFSKSSTTLQSFRSAIMQYVSAPPVGEGAPTPIIMVISETLLSTNTAAADSFTAHRLLGPELVNHPYINMIEFNPIAPTILTKALEAIVLKEARKSGRRRTPGPQVLKHIVETGDIRSAVSSLEFLCLRGDDEDSWSSKITFTKPKKTFEPAMTKAEEEALKLISNRESNLGIFHAVGRVIYNNRVLPKSGEPVVSPTPWYPQHRRQKVPENDSNGLIDELGTDMSTFVAALHENYAPSCSCSSSEETMESLSGCIDSISDADLLSVDHFSTGTRAFSGSALDSLRQDEMSFQVAVRGLLFCLPSPVRRTARPGGGKGDPHKMYYPTSLKLWRRKEELEGTLELLLDKLQNGKLGEADSHRRKSQRVGAGVESWQQATNFEALSAEMRDSDGVESVIERCATTKAELLLERLPYMAQVFSAILASRKPIAAFESIRSLTNISADALISAEHEADEEDAEPSVETEQWATDKPDADAQDSRPRTKLPGKGKQRVQTEGEGLSIPVENRIENLVLVDDDIVDD